MATPYFKIFFHGSSLFGAISLMNNKIYYSLKDVACILDKVITDHTNCFLYDIMPFEEIEILEDFKIYENVPMIEEKELCRKLLQIDDKCLLQFLNNGKVRDIREKKGIRLIKETSFEGIRFQEWLLDLLNEFGDQKNVPVPLQNSQSNYFRIFLNFKPYSIMGVISHNFGKAYISMLDIAWILETNDRWADCHKMCKVMDILPDEKNSSLIHIPLIEYDVFLQALERIDEEVPQKTQLHLLFNFFETGHIVDKTTTGNEMKLYHCPEYLGRTFSSWLVSKFINYKSFRK